MAPLLSYSHLSLEASFKAFSLFKSSETTFRINGVEVLSYDMRDMHPPSSTHTGASQHRTVNITPWYKLENSRTCLGGGALTFNV